MPNTTFPGFAHKASELSAYMFSIDTFVISLRSGEIISFVAPDPALFRQWLTAHGIRDITAQAGTLIKDFYFKKPGAHK